MNIIIEGNIASGKSTLLSYLKQHYDNNVLINSEPLDKWKNYYGTNLYELIYANPKKYCFKFQMLVLKCYLKMNEKNKIINIDKKYKIITERSIISAVKIFAQYANERENMDELGLNLLNDFYELFIEQFKIDLIIYLKTDSEICFKRLQERDREEENILNKEYVDRIEHFHEQVYNKPEFEISSTRKVPIYIVNGDNSTEKIGKELLEIIEKYSK